MKRFICFFIALFMCVSPCFAWSAESFLGNDYDGSELDDQEYYCTFLDPPDVPMFFSAAPLSDTPSGFDNAGGYKSVDFNSAVPTKNNISEFYDLTASGTTGVYPVTTLFSAGVANSGELQMGVTSSWNYFWVGYGGSQSLTYDSSTWNDVTYEYIRSDMFDFYFDLEVDGSSSSLQLDFNLFPEHFWVNPSSQSGGQVAMQVFINDTLVENYIFTSRLTRSFIYNFTVPITSARIVFTVDESFYTGSSLPSGTTDSGTLRCRQRVRFSLDDYIHYALITAGALDGFNDQTQDFINDHNAIESEWTGSMTDNFNSLNLSNFSYPSGLVSAFALLSGIFNDLWNGMGEYKIVYVLPLTLGVVLVIIGKMSRTERKSSSGSDGGESSVSLVVRDR